MKKKNMAIPKIPGDFPIKVGPKTNGLYPPVISARATYLFGVFIPFGSHKRSESQVIALLPDCGTCDGGGGVVVVVTAAVRVAIPILIGFLVR